MFKPKTCTGDLKKSFKDYISYYHLKGILKENVYTLHFSGIIVRIYRSFTVETPYGALTSVYLTEHLLCDYLNLID